MKVMIRTALLFVVANNTPLAFAEPPQLAVGDVHGAGGWATAGEPQRAVQRWEMDIHRAADGSLGGRVILTGSPLASAANIQGKADGRRVWGELIDDGGSPVASFTGVITPKGIHGSYRDRTGENGRWEWDGTIR